MGRLTIHLAISIFSTLIDIWTLLDTMSSMCTRIYIIYKKASELDIEELINPKPRNENNTQILPLVTTYYPRNKNITPIVRQLTIF